MNRFGFPAKQFSIGKWLPGPLLFLLFCGTPPILAQTESSVTPARDGNDRRKPPALADVTQAVGQAIRVLDGATLLLKDGRIIRLIGLLPPSLNNHDYYAEEAKQVLETLVAGKQLDIWMEKENAGIGHHDASGRVLAYVYLRADGLFLNRELLRRGTSFYFSQHYTQKKFDFLGDQYYARKNHLGVWTQAKESPEETAERQGKPFQEEFFAFDYDSPDKPLPTDVALEIDPEKRINAETISRPENLGITGTDNSYFYRRPQAQEPPSPVYVWVNPYPVHSRNSRWYRSVPPPPVTIVTPVPQPPPPSNSTVTRRQ
ncbi:MAG: thermonuclease family protein [Blastocatellia bacterium]|nr:thermonuclease family protein [Blastocatellia bacterium]